jgi:hypothetical protein
MIMNMNITSVKYIMAIWFTLIAYSYISFFDKWNWYALYLLNIVQKSN